MINFKKHLVIPDCSQEIAETDQIIFAALLKEAIDNNETIFKYHNRGKIKIAKNEILEFIKSLNLQRVLSESSTNSHYYHKELLINNDSCLYVNIPEQKTGELYIGISSTNELLVSKVKEYFESRIVKETSAGTVYSIAGAGGGYNIINIGVGGIELERHNYTESVLSDYDYVVKDLKSKSPSGRISILEGVPGSGKSFLLRALMMDVPNSIFVIVTADIMSSLNGPDLMPTLIQAKQYYATNKPIVLVIEDADECLVSRQADNLSKVSSLLNMGDGIFGDIFDLRIVATTNIKTNEIDPAIIRDGRLSKHIKVNYLDEEMVMLIFTRLMKEHDANWVSEDLSYFENKNKITLAQIYKKARSLGWMPSKVNVSYDLVDSCDDDVAPTW